MKQPTEVYGLDSISPLHQSGKLDGHAQLSSLHNRTDTSAHSNFISS